MKKVFIGFLTLAAVVATLPMFAAFEAHVINVTATIENALSVNTNALDFGTVFPQEHLKKDLEVKLSQSFQDEGRVDDVSYFIRQKPKCAITSNDGKSFDAANTKTGHVVVGDNQATTDVVESYWINCGDAPRALDQGESWGVLPSLCEYISKDGGDEDGAVDQNDETLASFHQPWKIVDGNLVWTDTRGYLAKSAQDIIDSWIIDLAVPCFGGNCAQDWARFVDEHDGDNKANPDDYVQPAANEHKIFGCDLWVEVNGVSEAPTTPV